MEDFTITDFLKGMVLYKNGKYVTTRTYDYKL